MKVTKINNIYPWRLNLQQNTSTVCLTNAISTKTFFFSIGQNFEVEYYFELGYTLL